MSIEKSFSVTLKLAMSEWGSFESVRLLKGRSKLDESTLERINVALQSTLVPSQPVKTTVAIGDDAEQKVMNHLSSLSLKNLDFNVTDTSSQTGHGDMSVIHCGKRICIEVKCYTKPVPMKEIEKYHRSLALPEYDAGIMIQLDPCGYAIGANLKSPIDLTNEGGKPSAYLTAIDMDLMYPVICLLIASCGIEETIDQIELEKKKRALIDINEKILSIRDSIASQKKIIDKMESAVDDIIKLSL